MFQFGRVETRDGHAPLFSDAHRWAYPRIGAYMRYSRTYALIFAVGTFSSTRMAIPNENSHNANNFRNSLNKHKKAAHRQRSS